MTVLTNTFTSLFATSLVATQSLAIAAAPLMIGVFAGGLMGGANGCPGFQASQKSRHFPRGGGCCPCCSHCPCRNCAAKREAAVQAAGSRLGLITELSFSFPFGPNRPSL